MGFSRLSMNDEPRVLRVTRPIFLYELAVFDFRYHFK
jgi:hypothetical protein